MKLSIHLVTWNGAKYMPFLFDSLKKQTFRDWKLIILDNASSDDTVEKIKFELQDFPFEHELIVNSENKGFAGGHNQLYESCKSGYFLIINQDLYLNSDCIEKMVKFMDEHEEVAALAPRTMRWNFVEKIFTDYVDSLGLKVLRNRRVIECYAGENWCKISAQVLKCLVFPAPSSYLEKRPLMKSDFWMNHSNHTKRTLIWRLD